MIAQYDAVVCGGGPAGWVAAVSAARNGCRTALIEKMSYLGGTPTAGLVDPISGGYHKGKRVLGGVGWEFVERLVAARRQARWSCPRAMYPSIPNITSCWPNAWCWKPG